MVHLASLSRKYVADLPSLQCSSLDRYTTRNGLLYDTNVADDTPHVVVSSLDNFRLRIMFECQDAPTGGHRGREKTYLTVSRDYYWPIQYQFVRNFIHSCEVCLRVKTSPSPCARLQPLPVLAECWESVSMDFVFGFPEDDHKNNGMLVFVDRFIMKVNLAALTESITARGRSRVFIDTLF